MSHFPCEPADSGNGLLAERRPDPCTIVIFGASGDLTARKLLPALFNLMAYGHMPANFAIVGVARRPKTDESFRAEMSEAVSQYARMADAPGCPVGWKDFGQRVFYHEMSFEDGSGYPALAERLTAIEASLGLPPNRLYYLATKPEQFESILHELRATGQVARPGESPGWQRVIIEKPFGRDLASARALNAMVASTLDESQAFRIDHYLGKETVQNLLTFRFANAIWEPLWNRSHIACVQITAAETVGMEGGRGGYYDTAGALRDMVQNHLMQLFCLTAMEPPSRLEAEAIRNEKVKVLRTLCPLTREQVAESTVRGQYGPGEIGGKKVAGYREERGVAPDSATESWVALRLKIDNWRWAGVPFFLRTGKRMPARVSEIAIQFRMPPVGLFRRRGGTIDEHEGHFAPNVIVLRLQPDEGISLRFDAKSPGMKMEAQTVRMNFTYGSTFDQRSPEAYERLLLDAIVGDSTLFTRNDEVEASWEFITSIHEGWAALPPPKFPNYSPGEWGPAEADRLYAEGEGAWRKPAG